MLEESGIACVLRNERLAGALGEIPFVECWPELWVLRNGDALRARGIIDAALSTTDEARPPWQCPGCGETIEGHFDACWRCSAPWDEADSRR